LVSLHVAVIILVVFVVFVVVVVVVVRRANIEYTFNSVRNGACDE